MESAAFIPVLALAAAFTLLWGGSLVGSGRTTDWRPAFLRATILTGGLALLFGEGLSLLRAIDRWPLALCWALSAVVLAWAAWRRGALKAVAVHLRRTSLGRSWPDGVLLLGILLVVGVLGAVAWKSPPSTVDALIYHMARVVHWAQDRSLAHYPTIYAHQLLKPISAELAILNLRVLWGSDQVAGLVQWFSMVGSLVGVSWIASLMGARRRGQLLASLFALSIPMGILQSTSTQNDYVVAFWSVCLMALIVEGKKREISWWDKGLLALVVGLGTLTKGTFFVYVIPLLVWHFLPKLWREKPMAWLGEGTLVVAVVVICNAGFWARDIETFGGPYGPSDWLRANLTFLRLPSSEPEATPVPQGAEELGEPEPPESSGAAAGLGGAVARMVAFNLRTPSSAINLAVVDFLSRYPQVFTDDFFSDMANIIWSHEDTAGNPLHLLLILGSAVLVFLIPRVRRDPSLLPAGITVLATYLMIPVVVGHGASLWGLRYQLPFFVLWAPVFGGAVGAIFRGWIGWLAGLGLLVASLPWVLFNNTRPVIGAPPWPTRTESVFVASPEDLAFAMVPRSGHPANAESLSAIADLVQERSCRQVGLVIDPSGLEYLYWWALQAPQSGIRLENLNAIPETTRYLDPAFRPCVVVCTLCGGEVYGELPLIADFGGNKVYGARP